jgi:hypothetical protein
MLSITDKPGYTVLALIQDQLARALASKAPLSIFNSNPGHSLAQELASGVPIPRNVSLDFTPAVDLLKLPMIGGDPVLKAGGALDIDKVIASILDPSGAITGILNGESPAEVFNRVKDFFNRRDGLKGILDSLGSFIEGQFGIALSLITTLKNLSAPDFPQAIIDAVLSYFFKPEGFVTVDEVQMTPPMQSSGISQQLADAKPGNLRSMFSEKSGERYVRDLITVIVEASGDKQYELRRRYQQLSAHLAATQTDTAKQWFKGFGTMAEAGVTSAVEETVLGIAQFQTNALIAASAGTYAGTLARKATQHVFLSELGL